MPTLVLLRHGQSLWNLEGRFTGWVDVDLSPQGEAEALRAGELISQEGLEFDRAFASVLTRAIRTAELALGVADQLWIPVLKDWRLNERHYGGLTGLSKAETAEQHGAAQVMIWRRSYDVAPPPLVPGGEFDFAADRRYAGVTPPATESLKTTLERVLPYWDGAIAPALAVGERVIVVAHGNSIRAIVKHLFAMSEEAIVRLEIPTGNPLVVELSPNLRTLSARYLDPERAEALPPAQ
ncbi:MAG TPA: 2,3-diphosphoglycerate-dependent phosphoglycerate mutase [Caulobacteraceae bacterium]|jgi:2,3-bisphosphoglycerate-dependent phosphoglycerate mutase